MKTAIEAPEVHEYWINKDGNLTMSVGGKIIVTGVHAIERTVFMNAKDKETTNLVALYFSLKRIERC